MSVRAQPRLSAYPRRNTLNEFHNVPAVTRKEAIATERTRRRRSTYRPNPRPIPEPAARREPRTSILSKAIAPIAMTFAAGLLVATTIPANAFITTTSGESEVAYQEIAAQELTTVAGTGGLTAERSNYTVDEVEEFIANAEGFDAAATSDLVVWPVGASPISAGFGLRDAPCAACSSNHKGIDFTPGSGYPISAIADGVVSEVQVSDSGYGNWVLIDHVVDGQVVQSGYAHMQFGSITVSVGDFVSAGQQIGAVGNTGVSTGAHLHFELRVDETQVDPQPWLETHANG